MDSDEKKRRTFSALGTGAKVAAGAAVGVAAISVGAPVLVAALGFQAGGIAAGTVAANAMSYAWISGVGTGVIATCQSVGAVGAVSSSTAALGGVVGAAAVPFIRRFGRKPKGKNESTPSNENKAQDKNEPKESK